MPSSILDNFLRYLQGSWSYMDFECMKYYARGSESRGHIVSPSLRTTLVMYEFLNFIVSSLKGIVKVENGTSFLFDGFSINKESPE